jgi:predicted DsbA family dithiol-disulfide isomerase
MQLDIVSDFVCPWCYVGKRRLEKALAQRPDLEVSVRWLPFQLSPDIPPEGIDRMEYYVSIFGEKRAEKIVASMHDTGKDDAIDFQNKPGAMSPNTLLAHALMEVAQSSENANSDRLAERLFHAHHVDCENIGDPQVLKAIAAECGLEAAEVDACIDDTAAKDRVKVSIKESVGRGVSGVPFFVFANEYGLSGAQPVEELVATLDQLQLKASD